VIIYHALAAFSALFFAAVQLRLIGLVVTDYQPSMEATDGVLTGCPHWKVYQSRLFAPLLVGFLELALKNQLLSHKIFQYLCLSVAGYLMLVLSNSWAAFFLMHILFAFTLKPPWLYPWDFAGVIIWILFVWMGINVSPSQMVVGLFMVALCNHENALFIALYLILRGDYGVGAGCLVFGMVWTELIRRNMMKMEIGPTAFSYPELANKSFHNQIGRNLEFLRSSWKSLDVMTPIFLLLVCAVAFLCQYTGLAVTHMALVVSIAVGALLREPRSLLVLVPFATIGFWQ
jgi:hypothetical protein